ncbi:Peroxisomal acyl-coenzyme A oxidase 1, partial [Podila clonocystis]
IYNASVAHCQFILVQNFILGIRGEMVQPEGAAVVELSPQAKEALTDLSDLFALHMIHKQPGEFLTSGYLDAKQVSLIGKAVMDVMENKIRPNAVGFVDAFAFPDFLLNSALGRYDGKVYETYTEMATREPLNQTEVMEGYELYIKPFTNPQGKKGETMQARLPSTIPPLGIHALPNEILLAIFIHVARIDPKALSRVAQVCHHWRLITSVFEPHLWRTALLSTFPLADFVPHHTSPHTRHGRGYILGSGCEASTDWKTKFRIHYGWTARQAQSYVVGPCRPETISSALRLHPLVESGQEDHHHHHHNHIHNHHNLQGPQDGNCASSSSRFTSPSLSLRSYNNRSSPTSTIPVAVLGSTDALSCSLCTYSDLCVIPYTDGICVRTHRHAERARMQVLDRTMQSCIAVEDVHGHQELVSGMAVNDDGSILVSCSIDATVRVWLVQEAFRSQGGPKTGAGEEGAGMGFMDKVQRFGCPIRGGHVLQGHIGWVNAVAIQDTTVVSGGSDHTVRLWDALSGECLRVIPELYTSRDLGLGVYAVAIQGGVVGSGSVIEGYQLHDVATGQLLLELDEPLSSREHFRFESADFQHYASRMAMTENVVVTNSKLRGLLCVWDRGSGKLLYRIRACPPPPTMTRSNGEVMMEMTKACKRLNRQKMMTHDPDELVRVQLMQPTLNMSQAIGDAVIEGVVQGEVETVHTFKLSSSGAMLMCAMCDGRVSLFEFGEMSQGPKKVLRFPSRQVVGQHHCGYSAWIWSKDVHGQQQLVLV